MKVLMKTCEKIIFSNSPKYIFEVFGLMFMGFLTFINFIYIKSPIEELIPILIFYIIIFYRVLPSVSAINSNLVTLHYNQASLKIIENEILDKSNFFVKKFVLENKNYVSKSLDCIKLVNINFSYKDIEIFKKMNFEIKKNEITLLTGESGKGKSTLISRWNKEAIDEQDKVFKLIEQKEANVNKVPSNKCLNSFDK